MKKPINFETLHASTFMIKGHSFYTEIDTNSAPDETRLWIYGHGSVLGDYCTLFELDWMKNYYSMKKCVLDQGDIGDYLFQCNLLKTDMIKTKDDFINHISKVILNAMELNHFKN
jgi:hypothetical protein